MPDEFTPQFINVTIGSFYGNPITTYLLMKRYTGDYSVTTELDDEGVLEVLCEGSRSKCFEYISDKTKKYWDEQYP